MPDPAEHRIPSESTATHLSAIPRGIWALGLVSLLMDVSSEMIHGLLPVFLVGVLGASPVVLGLIEGVAEATASITKLFSGVLSDWLGRRKILAVIGYGLGALSKPLFPVATSVAWVFTARFVDRIGKGIRGAPRDALVGDLTPVHLRGAAYGLRQSLDTVGAFAGPLLAMALMALTANNIRFVFWCAVIPAFLAVAVLVGGVREPRRPKAERQTRTPVRVADIRRLGPAYWGLVAVAAVLTLARFSEAFLVLRAQDVGLALGLMPLVLVVMNVVYAVSAYPVGALSDRLGRRGLIGLGLLVLIAADAVLAIATGVAGVMAGIALWGLHLGLTQGLLAALVAESAPAALRGSAFGLFHLAVGLFTLLASLIAGLLWATLGPAATFVAGAAFTVLGVLALYLTVAGRGRIRD